MARYPRILARVGGAFADLAALLAYTGPAGEPTAEAGGRLRVHDGATAGGIPHALLSEVTSLCGAVLSVGAAGVAYPDTDIAGATAVRIIPNRGNNYIPILTTGDVPVIRQFAETVLNLDSNAAHAGYHQVDKNFDQWAYWNGATVVFGTGPAWSAGAVAGSAFARGTGAGSTEIEFVAGVPVNKNAITLRVGTNSGDTVVIAARRATAIGTFRTVADGSVDCTLTKQFVSNIFQPTWRPAKRLETVANWTYSTAAFRQARADTNNKISFISAMPGRAANASVTGVVANASGVTNPRLGIGINSTTVDSSGNIWFLNATTSFQSLRAEWNGYLSLGLTDIVWLEYGAGSDTQTWLGLSTNNPPLYRSGIHAMGTV